MKFKTTARTWVVPSTATEEHWLSLSNLDRVVNPTFVSVVFYYHGVLNCKGYGEVVSTLKESLEDVLVEFYPLAGQLALREDGLVDLHCNDAGVLFLEAMVDTELREAGGGYGQPSPALSGIDAARLGPGPVYLPDQLMPLPVLIIQLTQFTCKSIALAVNWHHTVADGFSGCHFIRSWSEVARGEPIIVRPVHHRDLLKPREPLEPSLVQEGYSTRRLKVDDLHNVAHLRKEPAISKVFHIGKEGFQKLRSIIMMEVETTDIFQFTTVEVISAYLWKAMVLARGAVVDDHHPVTDREAKAGGLHVSDTLPKRTRFFIFVDGRRRLNLPPGYFGNVVCSACAVSDEAEIRTRSLSHIAMIIRKATRSISEDYFRSLIDWVEVKGLTSSRSEHVNSVGHDVAGTFWIYFPLYEVEFGWGKPTFATRNAPPRQLIDGVGMMPSPHGPGHMTAVLNLHADRMKNLEADPMFSSLFSEAPV